MAKTDGEVSGGTATAGVTAADQGRAEPLPVLAGPTTAGEFNTIGERLIPKGCFRMEDVRFEFDSSFVRPEVKDDMPLLADLIESHTLVLLGPPEQRVPPPLAIFGHADPVGNDDYNKQLSGRRALAVYAMLVRDVELWEDLFTQPFGGDKWGDKAVRTMLDALGHPGGPSDGLADAETKAAVKEFQAKKGLTADGVVGPNTRKALYKDYMDHLCGPRLELDKEKHFLARHGDGDGLKGDVQGCSEFNPVRMFSQEESKKFEKETDKTERNAENAPNRRVMILLFAPGRRVNSELWPCPRAKEGMAACKKRFFPDAEKRRAFQDQRREFDRTRDTFACRFYQMISDDSPCERGIGERLDSTFALRQFRGLARLHARDDFLTWMSVLFGPDITIETYDKARGMLLEGTFANPPIRLVAGGLDGHVGAYDRANKRILIERTLPRRAETDRDAAAELLSALVEEFGHHVDDKLRTELSSIGGDAELDEGARFAYSLSSFKQDIQGRTEFARFFRDGAGVTLEVEYEEVHEITRRFLSEADDDEQSGPIEFFGAGRGNIGQPNASFGHESIEDTLGAVGFSADDRKAVYFGNWLRDFSQVIDPKITRDAADPDVTHGVLRSSWTKVLDVLARERFADEPRFRVTPARAGVYRPEEHIDNPKDTADGTAKDPAFRGPFRPSEGVIDPAFGMKSYIRSPGPEHSSAEFIEAKVRAAVRDGRTSDGMRELGAALHTVEDFYAHSNFIELALIRIGHASVFPWARAPIASGRLRGKFPLVTGMFGSSDTVASVVAVAGEKMQQTNACVAGERGAGAKIAIILLEDRRSALAGRTDAVLRELEALQRAHPRLATAMCRTTQFLLHWLSALLGSAVRGLGNQIAQAQTAFENDPTSTDPTHSQLAKDHDDHPFHTIAAECAGIAAREVARQVAGAWARSGPTEQSAVNTAVGFLIHPEDLALAPGTGAIDSAIRAWAGNPANAAAIRKGSSQGWMREAGRRALSEWDELQQRADRLLRSSRALGDRILELMPGFR